MSVSLDGRLVLGWWVEVADIACFPEDEDGHKIHELPDGVQKLVDTALADIGMDEGWFNWPFWQWSLYDDCDDMWLGIEIKKSVHDVDDPDETMAQFAKRMVDTGDAYEKAACDIYRAVMGAEPENPPLLMAIAQKG